MGKRQLRITPNIRPSNTFIIIILFCIFLQIMWIRSLIVIKESSTKGNPKLLFENKSTAGKETSCWLGVQQKLNGCSFCAPMMWAVHWDVKWVSLYKAGYWGKFLHSDTRKLDNSSGYLSATSIWGQWLQHLREW